jgi:hypothetical protein
MAWPEVEDQCKLMLGIVAGEGNDGSTIAVVRESQIE